MGLWGSIGLNQLGVDTGVLRPLFGFVFLSLVPGLLIAVIIGTKGMTPLEVALYSVGFSIASVMFVAFIANQLLPPLGITHPISLWPLMASMTVYVNVLILVALRRQSEDTRASPTHVWVDVIKRNVTGVLFLMLMPLLAILGATVMNARGDNTILLILLLLIAVLPLITVMARLIPQELHSLSIAVVALSLLWQTSMISNHIMGADIHAEFYYQNLVVSDGVWNPAIPSNLNSMLSITLLIPTFQILMNTDAATIFKVVYPALYALVPVSLFLVFRRQIRSDLAYLSTFFFMASQVFIAVMPLLARQEIAELFFVLSMLAFSPGGPTMAAKKFSAIVFGLAIVVSHYGLAYIFAILLFAGILLARIPRISRLGQRDTGLEEKIGAEIKAREDGSVRTTIVGFGYVALFVVFLLTWYLYTSAATPFAAVARIGGNIYSNLADTFNPGTRDPDVLLAIGLASPAIGSIQRYTYLFVQYAAQAFIVIGVGGLFANRPRYQFTAWFNGMVLGSASLLGTSIALPYFATAITAGRMYHISLFFLSPFFAIGGLSAARFLGGWRRPKWALDRGVLTFGPRAIIVVVLLLVPYLLLSTGFVSQVTGDTPLSASLSQSLDLPRFNDQEVSAEAWFAEHSESATSPVYGDLYSQYLLFEHLYPRAKVAWADTTSVTTPNNLYLRCRNVDDNLFFVQQGVGLHYQQFSNTAFYWSVVTLESKVFDNGCVELYSSN